MRSFDPDKFEEAKQLFIEKRYHAARRLFKEVGDAIYNSDTDSMGDMAMASTCYGFVDEIEEIWRKERLDNKDKNK